MFHRFLPGKLEDFYSWMEMNKTVLNEEIEFAQKTLQVSHTL